MVANGNMTDPGNGHLHIRHSNHRFQLNHTLTRYHHNRIKMADVPGIKMAGLRDNRTSLSNMPTSPPVVPMATSSVPPTGTPTGPQCDDIAINYEIAPAVICAVCFVFGILYCFFGMCILQFINYYYYSSSNFAGKQFEPKGIKRSQMLYIGPFHWSMVVDEVYYEYICRF